MLRYSLILFLVPFMFASCSIEKRLYRNGFYVDRNHARSNAAVQLQMERQMASGENVNAEESRVLAEENVDTTRQYASVTGSQVHPEDSTKRKWFRKAERDTIPPEEEPVNIETGSKRWRYAGYAWLIAFLGLIAGFLIFSWIFYDWMALAFGFLLIAGILFFIFLSMRAHHRFRKQDADAAKQTVWGVIGRYLLYAAALAGAAVILNGFIIWTLKDM